jgi:hypothetical protein
MAEKRLQALAVASDYLAASGAVQAIFRSVFAAQEETSIEGLSRLTVVVDPQEDAYASVAIGKVLECNYTDGNYSEFRITSVETSTRHRHGSTAKIVAIGPRYDLRHRAGIAERVEADGFATGSFSMYGLTVSEWVTEILNSRNVPSYFVKGTITPTSKHQLVINNMTPLDALEQLATAADCELAIEAQGYGDELLLETGDKVLLESGFTLLMEGSNIKVEMGTIGSDVGQATTSDKAFLHGMKNMQSIRRVSDAVGGAESQATRVFPVGGPDDDRFTMADNSWAVSAVGGTYIDLTNDTVGAPMNEDDQLNGYYVEKPDGTLKEITDSTVANNRLTIGSSHGVTTSHRVTIRANSDGDDLTWLDSPSAQALYGKWVSIEARPAFVNASNLLSDVATGAGFLDGTYSSGVAAGWNAHGSSTLTENTSRDYYQHGTSSQKVVADAGTGIISNAITVAPSTSKPNVLASVWLIVTAKDNADTFVKVQLEDDTNTVLFPLDSEDAATTNVIGSWTRIDIVAGPPFYDFVAKSTTALKVLVTSVGGGSTFYVDGVSVENSARIAPTAAVIEGRSANLLWHEALTALSNRKAPHEAYDIGVVDLRRVDLDSSKWPNDELILGATVTCVDERLGIDTDQRISEIKRDLLVPGRTQIKLASDRKTLRGLIKPKSYPGTDPVSRAPIPVDFGAKSSLRVVPVTRLTNIALSNPGRITAFTWASGYPLKSSSDIQWKVTWDYTTGVDGDWDVDLVLFKDGVRVDAAADITATAKASSVETAGGHDSASAYYHVVGTLMDADSNTVQTVQTSPSLRLT